MGEFEHTHDFLRQLAYDYGQDIIILIKRYIKFAKVAQKARFSPEDIHKIYGSIIKVIVILGLNSNDIDRVFLSLAQMILKGKVTTEELRRQLGERLPGAFVIMADAIGVHLEVLDNMLKDGEILTSEVLPKFADALERMYGIVSIDKVDTISAWQARINNEELYDTET
jgi:tape measure domain-containing protein